MIRSGSALRIAADVALLALGIFAFVLALYFGREILLPFVLALVLRLIFAPAQRFLTERGRWPSALAAIFIVLGFFSLIVIGGFTITVPANKWLQQAPQALPVLKQKLAVLRRPIDYLQQGLKEFENASRHHPLPDCLAGKLNEMRLRGIDTMEAGNTFLPAFMADYNARFAKAPFSDKDLHRPLAGHDDLDDALAWKEDRSVSVNLTLQYDKVLFILEPNEIARSLARKRVTVIDYPDGRLAIRHNGVDLPYWTFDKRPQVNQAAIVENKRLGPVLAYIAEKQKELDMSRSAKAPRRRGQSNHMFKVG
jgi:hypothetical protein